MNLQAGPLGLVSSLGLVSKIILLFLFGFSVLSWAIILYKFKVYRRSDAEDQRFLSSVAKLNDVEEMRRQARRAGESPSAAVLLSLLDRLPDMPEAGGKPQKDNPGTSEVNPLDRHYLERSMAYIVQGQLSKMESYLPFLATTGNITPFIGLLGTVLGIIDSFREIGQQGTASIGAVAPGVAEALVATAMGLFTAIPAVVAYNYFLSRIRRMSFRLETFSVEVLNSLLRRVGARGATS